MIPSFSKLLFKGLTNRQGIDANARVDSQLPTPSQLSLSVPSDRVVPLTTNIPFLGTNMSLGERLSRQLICQNKHHAVPAGKGLPNAIGPSSSSLFVARKRLGMFIPIDHSTGIQDHSVFLSLIPGTEQGWAHPNLSRLPSFRPPRFDPFAPKTLSVNLTNNIVLSCLCIGSSLYWNMIPELNQIALNPPELISEPPMLPNEIDIGGLMESLNAATGTQEFGEGRSSRLLVEKIDPDKLSNLRLTLEGYLEDDSQKSAAFFISMVILALTMTAVAARVHFSS